MIAWLLTVGLWLLSGPGHPAVSETSGEVFSGEAVAAEASADFVVESYARDYSVSVEEAERRLGRIRVLQAEMASIREVEGSRVAGWGINHGEDFGAWVWLAGNADPGVEAQRIAAAHDDVEIRTGAAHTYEELRAAQDRFDPASLADPDMSAKIAEIVVYTSVDVANNSVEIGIDPGLLPVRSRRDAGSEINSSSNEGFVVEAGSLVETLQEHTGVGIVVTDAKGFSKRANFRAGRRLSGGCTAGFAAKQIGGPVGLITAAHCGTYHEMYGESLPFVVGGEGPRADAQFNRIPNGSSHQITNDYKCGADARSICEVTGTAKRADMMGAYVCHTGSYSGVSCGNVTSISVNLTVWLQDDDACMDKDGKGVRCRSVFVKFRGPNLKNCDGDSGGPVYDAKGVAYGIMTAGYSFNCQTLNTTVIFSAVKEVENYLGVRVLTDEPPGAPENVRAKVSLTGTQNRRGANVSWEFAPPSSGEDVARFMVYRRRAERGTSYKYIGDTESCCDYLDRITQLLPGVEYLYRVKSVGPTGLVSSWGPGSNYAWVRVPTVKPVALGGPSGVRLNGVQYDGVLLLWSKLNADVDKYDIYRRAAVAGQQYKKIGTATEIYYHDVPAALTPGTEYYYRVKTVSSTGAVGHWGIGSNYARTRIPALTGLRAEVSSDPGLISVSWEEPIGDITGYEVYRRVAVHGRSYAKVGESTTASYSDQSADLVPGAEYYYRVKAVGSNGVAGGWGSGQNYSGVVAPAVGNLRAVTASDGVAVLWSQPIGDVARYEVYRRIAVQGQAYAKIGESTTASYLDRSTGLASGTEYYYRVKAVGSNGVRGGWGPGPNYASVKYRR